MAGKFLEADITLDCLGLSEEQKHVIYQLLAAIIHIGNIEYSDDDEQAKILERSKPHIDYAASLLNISTVELMDAIFFRTIEINGEKIL